MLAAEKGRVRELLPLRHGRMARSAFKFYRGAALTMASGLASTPVSGLRVQCCGDAHLSNFGGFATPERRVIFSINDLDETLPAPWEWDVKRLAASFVVACRDNALSDACARDSVQTCVRAYRESIGRWHLPTRALESRSSSAVTWDVGMCSTRRSRRSQWHMWIRTRRTTLPWFEPSGPAKSKLGPRRWSEGLPTPRRFIARPNDSSYKTSRLLGPC
jgi:uncharacterized protein (DUF2252 family)